MSLHNPESFTKRMGAALMKSSLFFPKKNCDKLLLMEHNAKNIVTAHVTDMKGLFKEASSFNSDISSWDVSTCSRAPARLIVTFRDGIHVSTWDYDRTMGGRSQAGKTRV